MIWWLRVLDAFQADLSSGPNIYAGLLTLAPGDPRPHFLASKGTCTHTVNIHSDKQIYINE